MTGDLEARYDRLLAAEGAALRRVAAAYERDPGRREDLFQEICLALWQALPRFRGDSSERTFLFRIAHNRGLTHRLRRRGTAEADLDEAAEVADPAATPEAAAGARQRQEILRRAVFALPLPSRQVLTLALEGFGAREIGEILGISENNAAVRLTRARKSLREQLEPARSAMGASR